jgi:hypothetical protein
MRRRSKWLVLVVGLLAIGVGAAVWLIWLWGNNLLVHSAIVTYTTGS